MGVSDLDISKIQNYPFVYDEKTGDFYPPEEEMDMKDVRKQMISESQQYKLAGNSIVVQVLEGIFTQLFRKDSDALF